MLTSELCLDFCMEFACEASMHLDVKPEHRHACVLFSLWLFVTGTMLHGCRTLGPVVPGCPMWVRSLLLDFNWECMSI